MKSFDKCWLWTGTVTKRGYGSVWWKGKNYYVHRRAYEEKFGKIPKGLYVCHHCDVKLCINPDHLFLGTAQQNSTDMVQKNRQANGIKNGNRKLTENEVHEIRKNRQNGIDIDKLAEIYKVNRSTIRRIVVREIWRHI